MVPPARSALCAQLLVWDKKEESRKLKDADKSKVHCVDPSVLDAPRISQAVWMRIWSTRASVSAVGGGAGCYILN